MESVQQQPKEITLTLTPAEACALLNLLRGELWDEGLSDDEAEVRYKLATAAKGAYRKVNGWYEVLKGGAA
jgi:hypothetical protein